MASEISVESVCQFIIAHGGKVKNTVLVSNFKKSLNNAATRDEARQKFKECVNTVAVVKTENGDKYVQLKKKYRPPSLSSSVSSVNSEVSTEVSTNTSMDQAPPITSFPSYGEPDNESNTSFTPKGEVPYADAGSDDLVRSPRNPDTYPTTDFPVHEARPAEPTPVETYDNVISASKPPKSDAPPASKTKAERKSSPKKQASKPQISAPKSVASEDMIEDGPPKRLTPISKVTEEKVTKVDKGPPAQSRPPASKPESGEFAVPSAPRRKKTKDKKENVPPSPSLEHRVPSSIDRTKAGLQALATEQGRISRNRPISLMQTSYAGSVERARLNFQNKQRQNEDTTSLALSERSVDSKGEAEEDQERGSAPICLDPNDKLWIIKSAQANMVEMRKLLDLDPTLAEKRDFVMGYTALHWAAKKGNIDMVNMLLDQKIDVNARSNGGYTPLHLAAIHGHEHIISHLLEYEADPTIRDYSGRQAIHYLKSLSLPLQSKRSSAAQWKYHAFAGTEYGHTVAPDTHAALSGKNKHNKRSSMAWENPSTPTEKEPEPRTPEGLERTSSTGSGERKGSTGESRGVKLSRTESMLRGMGLRRRPSQRKSKNGDGPSHEKVFVPNPAARPVISGPLMWKPAGPKHK
uniref:Ankyrin repeat domain-containing protein SOWAHB-like n=1 Tax=Phallusia mammillata TaxID=59560 RepID=A0A6F9DU39_9ASCI|nr:ankyrin repeat domain-containing protein SOWAHB-like [Phallusia mammillata]